jgi:signal-transduction protein with cAMP-binding, CBS, and nucleotidyltransferase domain
MPVGDICNREVVVCQRNTSIVAASQLMRQHHVGTLVVVEAGDDDRAPVGIVTDRDIVVEVLAKEVPLESVCVGDIMSFDLLMAREQDDLWETLSRMRARGVRRVPVVEDGGSLVGLVTVDDLLDLLADELGVLAKVVRREQVREEIRRP